MIRPLKFTNIWFIFRFTYLRSVHFPSHYFSHPRESTPPHTPLWPARASPTRQHLSTRRLPLTGVGVVSLSLQQPKLGLSTCSGVDFWFDHLHGMDLKQFDAVFPEIVNGVADDYLQSDVRKAVLWLKQVIEYNVPFGKKTRGVAVVKAFKQLVAADHLKEEDLHLAQVLGWCVEMLQAVFLVADDIMDQSHTRRGKPCWYKQKGIGLIAINDAFSLESSIYMLLRKYFRQKTYYVNIIDLFHEITFQTVMGQSLDLMTSKIDDHLDLRKFTREAYDAIVKYKTAFYSFYLPIAVALYMAGIADDSIHCKARDVLLQMGHLFQVQDDYLDCFGDPTVTGKIGTDIEEGKCSWLVVTALERTNNGQEVILQENYGRNDSSCTTKVKCLYEELELPKVYHQYEEECYEQIVKMIGQMEGHLPTAIFYELVKAIYKRVR